MLPPRLNHGGSRILKNGGVPLSFPNGQETYTACEKCSAEIPGSGFAIIQAGFNHRDTTSLTQTPGCAFTFLYPPNSAVIHFKADGCVYGADGRFEFENPILRFLANDRYLGRKILRTAILGLKDVPGAEKDFQQCCDSENPYPESNPYKTGCPKQLQDVSSADPDENNLLEDVN